jgi:hypothetical protein
MSDLMTTELVRRTRFVVKQAKQTLRWYDQQTRYQRLLDQRLQRQQLRDQQRQTRRLRYQSKDDPLPEIMPLRKSLFDV